MGVVGWGVVKSNKVTGNIKKSEKNSSKISEKSPNFPLFYKGGGL